MSNIVEIKVPDIGDFDAVEVIEVLVAEGDTIQAEQSLITVESDKASMEIPASVGGVVKSLKVKVGDKVSQGAAILVVQTSGHPPQPHQHRRLPRHPFPLRQRRKRLLALLQLRRPRQRPLRWRRRPRRARLRRPRSPSPMCPCATFRMPRHRCADSHGNWA
jgi:pyruvate/2-oxoglutarate dehydrogenase complex dihydrolipoamide acyltransferase (E2) component